MILLLFQTLNFIPLCHLLSFLYPYLQWHVHYTLLPVDWVIEAAAVPGFEFIDSRLEEVVSVSSRWRLTSHLVLHWLHQGVVVTLGFHSRNRGKREGRLFLQFDWACLQLMKLLEGVLLLVVNWRLLKLWLGVVWYLLKLEMEIICRRVDWCRPKWSMI